MANQQTKKIANIALLMAVEMILSRFLAIPTPIVKISFSFLAMAMIAMLYGPWYAMFAATASEFIGATLFPTGAYFPGFTVTAALGAMVYGLCLHQNPTNWKRITIAVLVISLGLQLGLNTLWIQMITGKAYLILLPPRVFKTVVLIPMQIVMIHWAGVKLYPMIQRQSGQTLD